MIPTLKKEDIENVMSKHFDTLDFKINELSNNLDNSIEIISKEEILKCIDIEEYIDYRL